MKSSRLVIFTYNSERRIANGKGLLEGESLLLVIDVVERSDVARHVF
jgi:hypothetical protein